MIDWNAQWESFAPGFKEGKLPVDLKKFCPHAKTLYLLPGPGFGDLSHPTTNLMLKHLYPVVENQDVLDIGCGSGILTLASVALGAKSALGIDIEKEAIVHAKENALLNHLNVDFQLSAPTLPHFKEGVILMNMITSEQAQAVAALPKLKEIKGHFLISGLLKSQVAQVIETYASWGWVPLKTATSHGWSFIHFTKS